MSYAKVTYTGDGSLATFAIPFPFLASSHVTVTVAGVLKTAVTHYNVTGSNVVFTGGNTPALAASVVVGRDSSRSARLVDFSDGASLAAAQLDEDSNQLFYVMQEAYDNATTVGERLDEADASATATAASALAAAASALAADASADAAAASALAADASADAAVVSAAAAAASATAATTIVQNIKSADYTLVLSDAGKHIYHPDADNNARTFTIPANASVAFPIGTVVTFVNDKNTVTIAITSDTLAFAGSGATGSRTLAVYGVATALKVTATRWTISGTGLT